MPVNPRLIVVSDDDVAMIADVARALIDRNRERINTRIYCKLLFYGLLILASFGTTWSTTRSHAGASIVLMRDIAGVAAMELAWFAIARVYTVRASQASNLSALVVLLSWRYAPAPTNDEVNRLVRFAAPQRWTGSLCDAHDLEQHSIEIAVRACALWKTRQLYRLLRKTT